MVIGALDGYLNQFRKKGHRKDILSLKNVTEGKKSERRNGGVLGRYGMQQAGCEPQSLRLRVQEMG